MILPPVKKQKTARKTFALSLLSFCLKALLLRQQSPAFSRTVSADGLWPESFAVSLAQETVFLDGCPKRAFSIRFIHHARL
jgi:hypothetical protein